MYFRNINLKTIDKIIFIRQQSKTQKNMKIHTIITVFTLIVLISAGPLAPFAWSSIASTCITGCIAAALAPPAYATCVAGCMLLGPATTWWACFTDDTSVISAQGIKLMSNLTIGESVLTKNILGQTSWTTVKQLLINESEHEFVKIKTETKELAVTLDHVMIANSKLVKAKDLQVGYKLDLQTVLSIEPFKKLKRVTIITEAGTVLANNVLTTTICGDYIDVHGTELGVMEKWKVDHEWLMKY